MLEPTAKAEEKGGGIALQSAALAGLPGLRHAFFTRAGGVSVGLYAGLNCGFGSGDSREKVAENRRLAAAALGLAPERLLTLYQTHSPDVMVVDSSWAQEEAPRADAMVTATRGLALGILTADCGPLLLADAVAGVIGAAHAGWKGALTGVLESTLQAMESLGASRTRIHAALGPCIARDSYEVGPDFPAPFLEQDPGNARFFAPKEAGGRPYFDLGGYIAARLSAAGLESVDRLAQDTYAEEARFFSYRRATHRGESDYGRGLSAICLEP